MPAKLTVIRASVQEGGSPILSGRILTADETPLVQGDIASNTVSLNVYDVSPGGEGRRAATAIFTKTDISTTAGGPGGVACINSSTTYVTTYWNGKDGTGYNFAYRLIYDTSGATGPYLRGGHTYRCEFSASAGSTFGTVQWHFILHVEPLLSV